MPEPELLARLETDPEGLTLHEVALRYRELGPNAVAEDRGYDALRHLARVLANPLSLLLVSLAVINWFTGSREGADGGTGQPGGGCGCN